MTESLDENQLKFVMLVTREGLAPKAAARMLGYGDHKPLINNPAIAAAISQEQQLTVEDSQMSRQKVIEGFKEAIDIARMKSDPMVMVTGWREIGRLCGFYEPTRHKVEVSVNGTVQLRKMQEMTNEELLQLAEEGRDVLEGDYKVIE
jgi:hypothetical protein